MSFGIPELAIILVIALVLFGTNKLKSIGSDLGSAIKGFRSAISKDDDEPKEINTEKKSENKSHAN